MFGVLKFTLGCVGIAYGLDSITSCIGQTVVYNCTVPSQGHVWTVSSLPEAIGVTRGSPYTTEGVFMFELVADNGDSIVSSLSVVAFAQLDGVTISCDDAINPGQGLVESTSAVVLDPPTYIATTANGGTSCELCPANSVSTSPNSLSCVCLKGYYRNPLEHVNVPCTRPPSACRDLQVNEARTRANTITLTWQRPLITGRDDYYYLIHHSNPDQPGSFIQHNFNPLVRGSALVSYSVSGLRPLTNYTVRVSVLNGVSQQDPEREEDRRCEVTAMTGDISPQAPRHVTSFCSVIVWQVPSRAYGVVTGYDVMFSNDEGESIMFLKSGIEQFHVVRESELPFQSKEAKIQVRAKTSIADGIWSEAVSLNCSIAQCPCMPWPDGGETELM